MSGSIRKRIGIVAIGRIIAVGLMVAIGLAVVLPLPGGQAPAAHAQQSDTTPPQLSLPGSITVEATSASGVSVTFEATATDALDPNPSVVCNPSSDSEFALGTTRVICTATDAAGNSSNGSFPVTVRDITPPVLTIPANFKTEATSRLGALVIFTKIATDTVDPNAVADCGPTSGSVFSLGATTVSCTAIDASGNVAGDHFVVIVEDTSPPAITGRGSPSSNSNGWNNTDVAVTFACADSATAIVSCKGDVILAREGARQSVRGTTVDSAGNRSITMVSGINIDKTPPVVSITSPADGAEISIFDARLADWDVRDTLSGIGSSTGSAKPGDAIDTSTLGPHSFTVTAIDLAGNRTRTTHSYTVVAPFAVFFLESTETALEGGAPRDEFRVEGRFELGTHSNGINVATESVTIAFDGFSQTMPAGSFTRDTDQSYGFDGVSDGIIRASIGDDGRFKVTARRLNLSRISLGVPVPFSLAVGDDVGKTTVRLAESGPFRLETRQARDFFGTILSVGNKTLTVRTAGETIQVAITDSTSIRLSHKVDARIEDLAPGDLVAVSLEEQDGQLFGGTVVLVPGKTRNKHVLGQVLAITDTHVTVLPTYPMSEPLTFRRGPETQVRFYRGETNLAVGSFVVVAAVRDPLTGLLSTQAREINVIKAQPPTDTGPTPEGPPAPESPGHARILGVFEGVNDSGQWIVNGTAVAVGVETEFEDGVAVGQVLIIKAVLGTDGSLMARQVESVQRDIGTGGKARLEGTFQGIDELSGRWIISGTPVTVGTGTDTDGIPTLGRRVKVLAVLQEDGSLLAREIENKEEFGKSNAGPNPLTLEGNFQGIDKQGNWAIHGIKVVVDRLTRMENSPVVGQLVKVVAVVQDDGSYLARTLDGKSPDSFVPRSEVQIRGAIEKVLGDGSLVINGIEISMSVLTKLDKVPEPGDFAEVKALIQNDGSFLAIEVDNKGEAALQDFLEASPATLEGIIERINPDGSLVVNGIIVVVSPLSEIKGDLVQGSTVELEGLLQLDGSVVARELKGDGRRTHIRGAEASIQGVLETINRDDAGNIVSVVIDGLTIGLEALTEKNEGLQEGFPFVIKTIIVGGVPVARQFQEIGEESSRGEPPVEVGGTIDSLEFDGEGVTTGLVIDGLPVVINDQTSLAGAMVVGGPVNVKGTFSNGNLLAATVKIEQDQSDKQGRIEFELHGAVSSVVRDDVGNITGLVVDGNPVEVQALTRIKGDLDRGVIVGVTGIVSDGQLLASRIEASDGG